MNGLLTVLALWCACATPNRPSVLLLSVDTLRADFLGCYGSDWKLSPHIDHLATRSLVFDDAVCHTPLTGPSFASMFTSKYPRMVGATRNGLRIDDEAVSIAEQFQQAGYYTFAVQSNWTLRGRLSGLDRGFEVYNDDLERRRWGLFNGERRAESVTDIALNLLANRPDDLPFFAWIHYSDPHAPYRHQEKYSPIRKGYRELTRTERVRVHYGCEVAYTDAHVGRLLQALPQDTRILFVADHGESLYEHDYLGHGRYLYHNTIRIPMMICAPEAIPGRSNAPVQGMDVGPTLLGLAGLTPEASMLGSNVLAMSPPQDRPRFMETYGGAVPRLPGMRALMEHTSPTYQAVTCQGWKLVRGNAQPDRLFYLPDDPGELRNRRGEQPSLYEALHRLLEQWHTSRPRAAQTAADLRPEDVEALRGLGYIQ